jgi:hypothetical protein
MQHYKGLAVLVGMMALGFCGKPNLDRSSYLSSQVISEDSIGQGVKTTLGPSQGDLKSTQRSQVTKMVIMAKSSVNPRQEIQGNYDRIATSFNRKNTTVYLGYLNPTFVAISTKGEKASLKQVRENHESLLKETKFVQVKMAIQKLEVSNNASTASALVNKQANMLMRNHKILAETTAQDLWVKGNQGWRLTQSRDLTNQITLDGIRMPAN